MIKMVSLVLCSLLMITCSKELVLDEEKYREKWQLIRMFRDSPATEQIGSEMEWQEDYRLYSNNTFIKTRDRADQVTMESGTYTIDSTTLVQKLLILNYDRDNFIIASCNTRERKEELVLTSDSTMFGTWIACDGPGLEYKSIE